MEKGRQALFFPILDVFHSGNFDEFYYCSTFVRHVEKTRQMKEVPFFLTFNCHDLTSFFQTIVKFNKAITVQ